jgi:hypothetical protein
MPGGWSLACVRLRTLRQHYQTKFVGKGATDLNARVHNSAYQHATVGAVLPGSALADAPYHDSVVLRPDSTKRQAS